MKKVLLFAFIVSIIVILSGYIKDMLIWFWKFLGKNDKQIQAISVIVLVLITAYYAIETHNMATVMQKDFNANNRPFILVSGLSVDQRRDVIILPLENNGKQPANIKLLDALITFYTGSPSKQLGTINLTDKGRFNHYIFPNQKNATFGFPVPNLSDEIMKSNGFIFLIKFEYNAINIPLARMKYQAVINYFTGEYGREGRIQDIQIMEAN